MMAVIGKKVLIPYALGCVLFSFGVKLLIVANLGVDPYHAMIIGLVKTINIVSIKVAIVSGVVTVSVLLVWSAITHNRILISPFLTMFLVGLGIDILNLLNFESALPISSASPFIARLTVLVLGLLVDAYASALIISSGFGIRVMDLVALSLARGPLRRFTVAKLSIESIFVVIAAVYGGPLGLATIMFVLLVGLLIEPMMLLNRTLFGLQLHDDLIRRAPPTKPHQAVQS